MACNSRQKGKRGELELAKALKENFGWASARRSQQFCGDAGDSDLIAEEAPTLFIECKLVQNLNLHKAMDLAVEQAGGMTPAVFHRKDRTGWLVTVRIEDMKAFVSLMEKSLRSSTPVQSDPELPRGTT
jgi:Holliday junction resolvase